MRLSALVFTFTALVLSVSASQTAEDSAEPDIAVRTTFAESNPFGQVVNGEKNSLILTVENKSGQNVTLISASGSVHHPESDRVVKNLTSTKFSVPLMEGITMEVPYTFFSEFKPGDMRLRVWLEHSLDGKTYRVSAYDSVVTIVEPEIRWTDLKLLSTYLMVISIIGALVYIAYLSFFPQSRKSRPKKTSASSVSSPVGSVTATGAGGYQEEWIPEHHLRKTKKGASGAVSGPSGDEFSGSELSGAESRKRKAKK